MFFNIAVANSADEMKNMKKKVFVKIAKITW